MQEKAKIFRAYYVTEADLEKVIHDCKEDKTKGLDRYTVLEVCRLLNTKCGAMKLSAGDEKIKTSANLIEDELRVFEYDLATKQCKTRKAVPNELAYIRNKVGTYELCP